MALRLNKQFITGTGGAWVAVVAIPLAVNIAAWHLLVRPQRATLRAWRNTRALTELQPKLTALLSESHQTLTEWRRTSFRSDDPSAVMQAVKRLAGRHHVQLKQLNASETEAPAEHAVGEARGAGTMPVEIEANGRFNQLARWMSDVEAQAGLQVDSWQLTPPKGSDQSCQLNVKMTAFLQGA